MVVIQIVLGVNREELISRIANTQPNRFKLDSHLMSSLIGYIVPLVGVLTAISFTISDTLHTLLDPIVRLMR